MEEACKDSSLQSNLLSIFASIRLLATNVGGCCEFEFSWVCIAGHRSRVEILKKMTRSTPGFMSTTCSNSEHNDTLVLRFEMKP